MIAVGGGGRCQTSDVACTKNVYKHEGNKETGSFMFFFVGLFFVQWQALVDYEALTIKSEEPTILRLSNVSTLENSRP